MRAILRSQPHQTRHGTRHHQTKRRGRPSSPVQMPMTGPVLVADANDRSSSFWSVWTNGRKLVSEREIEVGRGYPMLGMPIPYGKPHRLLRRPTSQTRWI